MLTILSLITGNALSASAAMVVTIEELEQLLQANHDKKDGELAAQLSESQLTERLSTIRLSRLNAALRGPRARRAMTALADASAFLELPAADIPQKATPDAATQRRIITSAVRYVEKTIHGMPNFYATRVTTRFRGVVTVTDDNELTHSTEPDYRFGDQFSATGLYRDGREVVEDGGKRKAKAAESAYYGLSDWGIFGPLLGSVVSDALLGTITWSHWEQGAAGTLAVFHYVVPQEKSHFDVTYCCVSLDRGMSSFSGMPGYFEAAPGYHGEIAVDAGTGTIFRLVLHAELQATLPIVRDDVAVEYGPVEIGGLSYICPDME